MQPIRRCCSLHRRSIEYHASLNPQRPRRQENQSSLDALCCPSDLPPALKVALEHQVLPFHHLQYPTEILQLLRWSCRKFAKESSRSRTFVFARVSAVDT